MKRKIFLADDSITIQKVVELTFPESEYEVTCAAHGLQAFEKIKSLQPDIALLDAVMPDRTGYEICAQIKKDPDLKWMPVLLISGAFESYDEKRAGEAGANGRLTKPFESRALVAKVEELMTAHPNPARPAPAPSAPAPATVHAGPPPAPPSQTIRMSSKDLLPQKAPASAPSPAAAMPRPAPRPVSPPPPATSAPYRAAAPARTAPPTAPPAAPAAAVASHAPAMQIPRDVLDRAVREAVAAISEKVVREIAWEVIPDLAESIIQRRIRELEEEAASAR